MCQLALVYPIHLLLKTRTRGCFCLPLQSTMAIEQAKQHSVYFAIDNKQLD